MPTSFRARFALPLLLVLAACGGPRPAPAPPQADPAPLKAFAARGYESVEQLPVQASSHAWPLGGGVQHVQLLRPVLTSSVSSAALPLVIYLPGLGETAEAGSAWRRAWARAGYAVLSVQPLDEDASAYQSDLARDGAFRALGQRHYGAAALLRRVQALGLVVAEAERRGAAGEPAWQGINWQRRAVAGYDLGAYTAQVLAGEVVRGAEAASGLVPVQAALVLSPYANVADGSLDTRYRGVRGPVLSITSDMDSDPLGLVGAPALRTAPFQHMVGPDQYLLSLQGLAHARLSGGAATGGAPSAAAERSAENGAPNEESNARGRGGNSGGNGGGAGGGTRRRGGGGAGGEAMRQAGSNGNRGAAEPGGATATAANATAMQLRLIAALDVSTAFLDAHLRDDALARDWLREHAQRWLGTAGELRRK